MKKYSFFVVVIILITISFFSHSSVSQNAEKNLIFCNNANYGKLQQSSSQFKSCYQYIDLFQKYANEDGAIDPLILTAIAFQESSCNANIKGGLMRVDQQCAQEGNCPTPDSQIAAGLNILKQSLSAVYGKDLDGKTTMDLALFGYNRGPSLAKTAADLIQNQKLSPRDAMLKACTDYYSQNCQGTDVQCRYDIHGKDKCDSAGYGVQYPQKIYSIQTSMCNEAQGNIETKPLSIKDTQTTIPDAGKNYGTYEFFPSWKIPFENKELDDYGILHAKARELLNKCKGDNPLEECVNKEKNLFTDATSFEFTQCETPNEQVIHDLMEKFTQCSGSADDHCICHFSLDDQNIDGRYQVLIMQDDREGEDPSEKRSVTRFLVIGDDTHVDVLTDQPFVITDSKESLQREGKCGGVPTWKESGIENIQKGIVYTLEFSNGFVSSGRIEGKNIELLNQQNLDILKSGDQLGIINSQDDCVRELPRCAFQKTIYSFCLQHTQNKRVYRFALDFST